MSTVPRLFPGDTVVCIGTGPSLTQAAVDWCRGKARVVAINDAYRLAPWADVLYAHDAKWWMWHAGAPTFHGLKFGGQPRYDPPHRNELWPGMQLLRMGEQTGLSGDPGVLAHGKTSGYQAINLAVHLGAARIVLLGYDMKVGRQAHCFGAHPDGTRPPFLESLADFPTLVAPLAAVGVAIVNCTPGSALTCFPMRPLCEVLPASTEAAA